MLSLSKKTDYALIALAYLAERPGRVAPAREIAEAYGLPCALLMNLLKDLQQQGWLDSIRGVRGGYRLRRDPATASLYELVCIVDEEPLLVDCAGGCQAGGAGASCRMEGSCPVQAPLKAVHHRFVQFLKSITLADLIIPGRKIDVPVELVGIGGSSH